MAKSGRKEEAGSEKPDINTSPLWALYLGFNPKEKKWYWLNDAESGGVPEGFTEIEHLG